MGLNLLFFAGRATEIDITHVCPTEFKQAVFHYIKQTEISCLHKERRDLQEHLSYKKELRYLFKNYGRLAMTTLLYRVRAAHQAMIKVETDPASDNYKKYEQIASALLLVCAQVFCNDIRNQLLNALHDIDHYVVYWRYQQQHQLSYFFHKSPAKWVMGKSQTQEINYNLKQLEHKRRELYTMLGALMGHIHSFTGRDSSYEECYAWIEELFTIMSPLFPSPSYESDGSKFDDIAGHLSLKAKQGGTLKSTQLKSIVFAKKPPHFVRNWIPYTIALTAAGYALHYHVKNPLIIPAAMAGVRLEMIRLFNLSIAPFNKIYERIQTAFSWDKNVKNNDIKNQAIEVKEDDFQQLCVLFDRIEGIGKEVKTDIAKELAKSNTSLREDAVIILQDAIKNVEGKWLSYSNFDAKAVKADLQLIKDKQDPEAVTRIRNVVSELYKQTWDPALLMKLNKGDGLLRLVNDYLDPLHVYTDIIDEKILELIRLIAIVAEKLGRQGTNLAQQAENQLKQAENQLKDQELTLMFTSLIPLTTMSGIAAMMYKWISTHDYSLIRIGLADINALLIESAVQLNDHDYGKLVYLICKLRYKAHSLKDGLAYEFLCDIDKLESKQYSPAVKRGIVDNMFNKYAFLGRIAL